MKSVKSGAGGSCGSGSAVVAQAGCLVPFGAPEI